jgi:hypothetical protein
LKRRYQGFTIEGGWPSNVCYDSIYGVAVLGSATLNMSNSTVENIGGSALTDGCQGGVGIQVGLATSSTNADPGTATLTNDVVNTYQKNGITVDGTGSTGAILLASDGVSGDEAVSVTANQDKFATSNTNGVYNQSTSVINAENDWWGEATGPSVWSFGTGSSVTPDVNFFPWETNSSLTHQKSCTTAATKVTTGNKVVLCARGETNAYLANAGTGNVLLIGNTSGNDQLVGSSAGGETWIIGGTSGANTINGNNGTGYIQERGDTSDTVINASGYTVAAS